MIVILLYLQVMNSFSNKISIQVNENIYLKDPMSSELGKSIISESIHMIDELGFDDFTFKKLAKHIQSTEASVYRYFTNKHNLLTYLTMWYWSWLDYRVMTATLNIPDPKVQLRKAVNEVTKEITEDSDFAQINEVKLSKIIIAESSKIYLSKKVEEDNEHGFFLPYKDLVQRIADIILLINPAYKYPHMLVSTIIEGAHHQRYFSVHLPRLTDIIDGEDAITNFYVQMADQLIQS